MKHVFGLLCAGMISCTSTLTPDCEEKKNCEDVLTPEVRDSLRRSGEVEKHLQESLQLSSIITMRVDTVRNEVRFLPDSLRDEQTATLVLKDSASCGIQFGYHDNDIHTTLRFSVDGVPRGDGPNFQTGTYRETLPCGAHEFRWDFRRDSRDGQPDCWIRNVRSLYIPNQAYQGDWTFENGWPLDLQASGWVVNNKFLHQGQYSLWAGYMRDDEIRELRVPVVPGSTKLNFYYTFTDAGSGRQAQDEAFLHTGRDSVKLKTALSDFFFSRYTTKYSRILMPADSVVVIRFFKDEDAFSRFAVDDIRLLSVEPRAQQDGVWDFEDDFFPLEISPAWVIDNQDAYEGEYSLRTRSGRQYDPEFRMAVGDADSLSFWGKCAYGKFTYQYLSIVSASDTTRFACSSTWKKYTLALSAADSVRFIASVDPDAPVEQRVDLIKVW